MASFEIADCPTKLQLTEQDKAGKKTQTGTLTLTVRNATDGQHTGRVKVEPDQGAKPDWFALQGAPATNPREFEQDFAARGTQTVRVAVTVPAGEAAKSCLFRLVVTDERDPDNDFVRGPNVAFEIKAWTQPAPKPQFPWWIFVAAGVVVLLIVGGIVAYLVIPGGPQPVAGGPSGGPSTGPSSGPSGLIDVTKAQGEWRNVDANTRGVTRFVLSGTPMTVHVWGACHPTDCDWGAVPTSEFRQSASGAQVSALRAFFKTNFDEVSVTVTPVQGEMLNAHLLTHFTDKSGRPDSSENYQFRR